MHGYGFIRPDGGGPDVFFHMGQGRRCSTIGETIVFARERTERLPKVGDRVRYEIASSGAKTPHAAQWGFEDDRKRIGPHRASRMFRLVKRAVCKGVEDEQRVCVFWTGSYLNDPDLSPLLARFKMLPKRVRITNDLEALIRIECDRGDGCWEAFKGDYQRIAAAPRRWTLRLAA